MLLIKLVEIMKIIEKNSNTGKTQEHTVLYGIAIDSINFAKQALQRVALDSNDECYTLETERRFKKEQPKDFEEQKEAYKSLVNDNSLSDEAVIDLTNCEIIYNNEESFEDDGHYYKIKQ